MTMAVLVLTGIILASIGRLFVACVVSLLSWALLGFLGLYFAEQPRDANYVTTMVEQKCLPLKTPLRWHGHLRDEPTRLPWGSGYEIELSGAEFEEAMPSDVLKIGHHGSKNSTATEFLAAVQPHVGIISAGEDKLMDLPARSCSNDWRVRVRGS
jgi:hypothetical protein